MPERNSAAQMTIQRSPGATGLCAIKRLNLVFFVDRQDDGVYGRINIEADDVAQTGLHFEIRKNSCRRLSTNLACTTASIIGCIRGPSG